MGVEIRDTTLAGSVNSGTSFNCGKAGYDGWSSPETLPSVYCRFYYEDIAGNGVCRIFLAREYKRLIEKGIITADMLKQKVDDPHQYLPTVAEFGNVLKDDLTARAGGLNPQEANECLIDVNLHQAEKEVLQLKKMIQVVMDPSR